MNETNAFITLKLVTGETLLATYFEEDDNSVFIIHPMLIKTIPYMRNGELKENISVVPWSNFTSDIYFELSKKDIVFIKELHDFYIGHYLEAVEESLKTDDYSTMEEIREYLNNTGQSTEERIDHQTFTVEGNDTIN